MTEITKSLVEILELFFKQVEQGNLKVSHYPESYSGFNLKVSFGKGNIANVPWITFLKDGKSVKAESTQLHSITESRKHSSLLMDMVKKNRLQRVGASKHHP